MESCLSVVGSFQFSLGVARLAIFGFMLLQCTSHYAYHKQTFRINLMMYQCVAIIIGLKFGAINCLGWR